MSDDLISRNNLWNNRPVRRNTQTENKDKNLYGQGWNDCLDEFFDIISDANSEMKEILDVIHKTIYQFFDVCGDEEEVPMSDKDKLLLKVNKAICNNLKEKYNDGE